ncbi:MAG: hypothetical protein E7617_07035 [Ruminococcaceae bacterium]|nr:hypothetical protein [Oscillospiraceae bacterium]
MKKTIRLKAASLLLIITLVLSCATVLSFGAAAAESEGKKVEIVSNNIYYGDTLKLMYAVKAENLSGSDSVAVNLYKADGTEIETITSYVTENVNGEPCYVFTSAYGVPAQSIETEIYAKAVVTSDSTVVAESALSSYSVLEYLYERLTVSKDNGKVSDDQAAMYAGLVEYASLAEKVLTNKAESEKIANKSYVRVLNGTVGNERSAIYEKGTLLKNFSHSIAAPKYTVIWQIDKFDKSGNYIDSEVMTDLDLLANGYTVTDDNVIIRARENCITESDILSQVSTLGNPKNPNTTGGTYYQRGCVRFSIPVKAGTTIKLKEEYRGIYQIALNTTINPEYDASSKYTLYDTGWLSNDSYTTQAREDGWFIAVCFIHENSSGNRVNTNFTEDELAMLVNTLEVTGEKAILTADRGTLSTEEYNNQMGLYGSVPNPNDIKRQRIAFTVRMQAGTKVSFVGDSSVYNWAVVESSNTGSTSYMYDTGWNSTWQDPTKPYYITQIDGSYLLPTIKRIDGANLTHDEIDKLNSMFVVEGQKYYDNGIYNVVAGKDYAVNSVNHRGYVTAPENTLEAYRMSAMSGFKMVECDVNFTKDGYAVLLHDSTIDRTSNGTGSISSLTLAEVREYDFGSWKSHEYKGTKIPTFEEFIALCKELDLHPYIELKSELAAGQAAQLVETVSKYGLSDDCTWISFEATALSQIAEVDSGARLGYLVTTALTEEKINDAKSLQTADNEVFIDMNYGLATEANIELCKTEGFAVEVWTLDNTDVLDSLNEYVSGVTSNFIVAGKYLEEKNAE